MRMPQRRRHVTRGEPFIAISYRSIAPFTAPGSMARWQAAQPLYRQSPPRSVKAIVRGHPTFVIVAWVDNDAVLLRSEYPIRDRITPANGGHLTFLADLRDGPVVVSSPDDARWRFQLIP
jgi:hypothetical protein